MSSTSCEVRVFDEERFRNATGIRPARSMRWALSSLARHEDAKADRGRYVDLQGLWIPHRYRTSGGAVIGKIGCVINGGGI